MNSNEILFTDLEEALEELLKVVTGAVGVFDQTVVADMKKIDGPPCSGGSEMSKEVDSAELRIALDVLESRAKEGAEGYRVYLVDMAKVEALDYMGDCSEASKVVEGHV